MSGAAPLSFEATRSSKVSSGCSILARSLDALDGIGEGIFSLDHEGRFSYLNRAAQRLLPALTGAAASDLVGTVIWDASPSFAGTPTGVALRRAQAEGVPVSPPGE